MNTRNVTVLLEKEDDGFVSLCPELDIASQGDTVEAAKANVKEAVELFFETASNTEISERLHNEVYAAHHKEIRIGTLRSISRQSGIPKREFES